MNKLSKKLPLLVALVSAIEILQVSTQTCCGTESAVKTRTATLAYEDPIDGQTKYMGAFGVDDELAIAEFQIAVQRLHAVGIQATIEYKVDPSLAYHLELTNRTAAPGPYVISMDFPISKLGPNSSWADFSVELVDTNGDGTAYLHPLGSSSTAFQTVSVASPNFSSSTPVGTPLGSAIDSAGTYNFHLDPFSGPTFAGAGLIDVFTRFTLSPGDTVRIGSRFVLDEGTGIPLAEIQPLPDANGGPYYNVYNLPTTEIGDNAFVGSQTQINLMNGGKIGQRFNFDAYSNNRLNDNNTDIQINMSGGIVGSQFMALSGTTVNVSGGTMNGIVIAGSYNGGSSDVAMNISGGTVGAGSSGQLQAYEGSQVNITGGTVGLLKAYGGRVNILGGVVGRNFTTNGLGVGLGGVLNVAGGAPQGTTGISLLSDGTASVSGGTFATATQTISAVAGSHLNLIGESFLLNGAPITGLVYGTAFEIMTRGVTLSGVLADGSPVSIDLNPTDPFPNAGDFVEPGTRLTVRLVVPGDFNLNGIVDAGDYTVWRHNLGQQGLAPYTGGDGNGDGLVTSADYLVWKNNFGAQAGSGAVANGAVAEPATAWMLLTAAVAICGRRQSKVS